MTTLTSSIRRVGTAFIVFGSLALSAAAYGQASIKIDPASLKQFSDCKSSNSTIIITNSLPGGGNDFFQATFDDMTLSLANKRGSRLDSKGCIIEFDVELPKGYTVGTVNLELNGFMDLPAQAQGSAEMIVTIPGLTRASWNNSKYVQVTKTGPFDDDFAQTAKLDFGSQPGQLCPQKVRVYIDVLAWARIGWRAAADAKASMGIDIVSGLFAGSGSPLIGLVECKKDDSWWWY